MCMESWILRVSCKVNVKPFRWNYDMQEHVLIKPCNVLQARVKSNEKVETGLLLRVGNIKIFFYFSTKTYVVGTQKNHLDETVLLSTQNLC